MSIDIDCYKKMFKIWIDRIRKKYYSVFDLLL